LRPPEASSALKNFPRSSDNDEKKEKIPKVTVNNYLVKTVLQTYDRHLGTARRIARLNKALSQAGITDSVSISPDAKRKQLVERIAREIVDNLLVAGSSNPVVQDIRKDLEEQVGLRLLFSYSPDKGELVVHKQQGPSGTEQATPEERDEILERLWTIALNKVDETML
jgi:hypothetical protein